MRWTPGRLTVMAGGAAAAGLALGAAQDGTSWILAAAACISAAIACWRLARHEESPAGPGGRVFAWLGVGAMGVLGALLAPLGLWALLVIGGLVAAAAGLEAALFPDLRLLAIERVLPQRLSLG